MPRLLTTATVVWLSMLSGLAEAEDIEGVIQGGEFLICIPNDSSSTRKALFLLSIEEAGRRVLLPGRELIESQLRIDTWNDGSNFYHLRGKDLFVIGDKLPPENYACSDITGLFEDAMDAALRFALVEDPDRLADARLREALAARNLLLDRVAELEAKLNRLDADRGQALDRLAVENMSLRERLCEVDPEARSGMLCN